MNDKTAGASANILYAKYAPLGGFLALVFIIAAISTYVTMPAVHGWYQIAKKPAWTPPDSIFAPVWSLLYILMAISGWRVWQKLPGEKWKKAANLIIAPYWVQLALNFSWSVVFFYMKQPIQSVVVIAALLIAILLNIQSFLRVDKPAALLLVPYILWVAYAASLNIGIVLLNPGL